jgi:coatomer protein complex subunit gamma
VSPFWGLEKAAVLQDARCFNDSQLDARRCQQARTRRRQRGTLSVATP